MITMRSNIKPSLQLVRAQLVEHSTVNRKVLGSNPNERVITTQS